MQQRLQVAAIVGKVELDSTSFSVAHNDNNKNMRRCRLPRYPVQGLQKSKSWLAL